VTLVERSSRVLPREDDDAAAIVQQALAADGVAMLTGTTLEAAARAEGGGLTEAPLAEYTLTLSGPSGAASTLRVDAVLSAIGRAPNVAGAGLDAAGVQFDGDGVVVDANWRTHNPDVYATGDCASKLKFTHAADWQARCAVRNMFLGDDSRESDLLVPWATYTDPEVAHVGLSEADAEAAATPVDTFVRRLADVDRCKCDGLDVGFVKLLVKRGTDEILGATVVAPRAGDMISELTLAIQHGIGCSKLAGTIHPYPTTQEAVRQAAAMYWQQKLGMGNNDAAREVVGAILEEQARKGEGGS